MKDGDSKLLWREVLGDSFSMIILVLILVAILPWYEPGNTLYPFLPAISGLFIIGGAAYVLYGYLSLKRLLDANIVVAAKVKEKRPSNHHGEIYYSFSYKGEEYVSGNCVSYFSRYYRIANGDPILVYVDPRDPRKTRIKGIP